MKTKLFVAVVLVLVGTNLFTYTTTRYETTRTVLIRAEERLKAALNTEGLYEQVFPADQPRSAAVVLAISQAGGGYYWWNDALWYWGAAVILTISGFLVPFVGLRRRDAAS